MAGRLVAARCVAGVAAWRQSGAVAALVAMLPRAGRRDRRGWRDAESAAGVAAAAAAALLAGGSVVWAAAPPEQSRSPLASLASMDDALAFGVDRAIILIARGHKRGEDRAAVAAFKAAAAAYAAKPGEPPLRWYVVDDSTPAAVAEAMTARLGLEYERPFVVATDRFWQTERKYLPGEESVPTTRSINAFVAAFRRGELAPVRLGQPRPPRDRVPACSALWEIVTDSFTELVLDPAASGRTDVLVEGYTPRCDSCKALAPRFRMFAALTAKHWPTLRVARFDIYSNDRITEWMPEVRGVFGALVLRCG